jgi:Aspartyl protease
MSNTVPCSRALTFIFSAMLLMLLTMPMLAQSKTASIAFTTNSDGMAMIPVTVGESTPIQVVLDTGAGLAVLAPSVIEKIHGVPAGVFTGFRMTGERLDISLYKIPRMTIGPIEQKDVLVGSWDVLDRLHLDGIVSLSQFKDQPFTLDFGKKLLTFETAKTLAKRRTDAVVSPIQLDEVRGISIDMFAQFLLAGQPGQCEIDTGSPTSTLNIRYMKPLDIQEDGKDVRKIQRRTIAGVPEVRYDTHISEIALAASPKVSVAHPPVSFGDVIYDCVVGVDFWAGKEVTVDIPGRQLTVQQH